MANLQASHEIISDKSKNAVVSTGYIKHGSEWLDNVVNTAVSALNGKADKTYVDAELAKKANTEALATVDAKVNGKADAGVVSQLQATVNTKADASTVAALSDRVTANTTKTVDLQSQIDNLVVSGTGDSNPEVVQARTDASGVTHATLKTRIDTEVTNLKSDLNEQNETIATVARDVHTLDNGEIAFDNYEPGSLDDSGNNSQTGMMSRIRSKEIIHNDYEITLIVDDGYSAYVALYNADGTYKGNINWSSGLVYPCNIVAGSYFRLIVRKQPETSYDSISELASHVRIVSATGYKISQNAKSAENAANSTDFVNAVFEKGVISETGVESNGWRIRSNYITADKSIVLHTKTGYKTAVIMYNDANEVIRYVNYTNADITIPKGTKYRICSGKGTNADNYADFTIADRVDALRISAYKYPDNTIYASDDMTWINGSYISYRDGGLRDGRNNYYTDYVDVENYQNGYINVKGYKYAGSDDSIAFYNANKKFIKAANPTLYAQIPSGKFAHYDVSVQVPSDAKYMRYCTLYQENVAEACIYLSLSKLMNTLSHNITVPDESTHQLPDAWISAGKNAYDAVYNVMLNKGYNAVPMFLESDSHGSMIALPMSWSNEIDSTIKAIHLGDIVTDKYNADQIGKYYNTTSKLKNYASVVGNHDIAYGNEAVYDYIITKMLPTSSRNLGSDINYYTVLDNDYRVKYITLNPFVVGSNHTSSEITVVYDAKQLQWLVDELKNTNGYDVVIMTHVPIIDDFRIFDRSGEIVPMTGPTARNTTYVENIIKAYQAKTDITIELSDGAVISADFSNTENKILCVFHGHTHKEGTIFANGIRRYVADNAMFEKGYTCAYACIDRTDNKLKIFKFSSNGTETTWELPLFND